MVYYKDTGYVTLKNLKNEEIECLRLRSGLEFQEGSEIYMKHYHICLMWDLFLLKSLQLLL